MIQLVCTDCIHFFVNWCILSHTLHVRVIILHTKIFCTNLFLNCSYRECVLHICVHIWMSVRVRLLSNRTDFLQHICDAKSYVFFLALQERSSFLWTRGRTSTSWRWTLAFKWSIPSPSASRALTSFARWSEWLQVSDIAYMFVTGR